MEATRKLIGANAGKVYSILREGLPLNFGAIRRLTKLKAPLAHQAIGWLACEGKLNYVIEGKKVKFTLTDAELGSKAQESEI